MQKKVNKHVYIFFCALLGILLLVIVQRIIIMLATLFLIGDPVSVVSDSAWAWYAAIDYLTLWIAVLGGIWYGLWIGEYWYKIVYEEGRYLGVFHHILHSHGDTNPKLTNIQNEIAHIQHSMVEEAWHLEDLSRNIEQVVPAKAPVRKKVVRRSPAKKTT
jgi:hypothetical protein